MKCRLRYFSLLEVMIALGLTLMIFTVLLGAYLSAERSALSWQKEEEAYFPQRYLQHRLEDVFRHLTTKIDQQNNYFFSTPPSSLFLTDTPSLIFSYDNGILLDPRLSGEVLGRLFIDLEGNLTLLTLPSREIWKEGINPPSHAEILMRGVRGLQFEFYHLPQDQNSTGAKDWKSDGWNKELKYLPAIIKMTLIKDEQSLLFLFPVPQVLAVVRT